MIFYQGLFLADFLVSKSIFWEGLVSSVSRSNCIRLMHHDVFTRLAATRSGARHANSFFTLALDAERRAPRRILRVAAKRLNSPRCG